MSEALEKKKSLTTAAIEIWSNVNEIRKLFAANLDEREFTFFMTLGKGLGANPFKREIWAVKYDASKPASIFCGRDFYRRKAQEQEDYNGHVTDAVYTNDQFKVVNGIPEHAYSLVDRGELIGAYTAVYRKSIDKPFFVFVKLSEYDKGFSLWKTMKETLIKKVSEAQGLRGAYQGIFAGTYDESEQWVAEKYDNKKADPPATPTKAEAQPTAPVKHETPKPKPGETEPPDEAGTPVEDVFARLDKALAEFCDGNEDAMQEKLQALTSFPGKDKETGKPTGKIVPGVKYVSDLRMKNSEVRARIALDKLTDEMAGER
jgi:phage recombination protein Bet